jgi:hypothetical protein
MPCVPGHEPVEVAVHPGGVNVGKTPIMGFHAPCRANFARCGISPHSIKFFTSSIAAPSIPFTMARFAGGIAMEDPFYAWSIVALSFSLVPP